MYDGALRQVALVEPSCSLALQWHAIEGKASAARVTDIPTSLNGMIASPHERHR